METSEDFRERLIARHPSARRALEQFANRLAGVAGYGAVAPLERGCCAACRVRVAAVRRLAAEAGEVVSCPNCSRFLYSAPPARPAAGE